MRPFTSIIIGLALAGSMLLYFLMPRLCLLVITSSSMRSSLNPGDLVAVYRLKPQQYRPGDVVAFVPPQSHVWVTHRIGTVVYRRDVLVVTTKGDANTNGDPWYIAVGSVRGKVVLRVPKLGYVFSGVRSVALKIIKKIQT